MKLREDAGFCRTPFTQEPGVVAALAGELFADLKGRALLYMGYDEPDESLQRQFQLQTPTQPVDNFFTLFADAGFESHALLLTVGLRSSRFASILFWEAFHALKPNGLWLDVDSVDCCSGTALCDADFLDREYFRPELADVKVVRHGSLRARLMCKSAPSRISPLSRGGGWTFGILTAGPSVTAERMMRDILAHAPSDCEVIICGPMPEYAPSDERIRHIDLEAPEPRGWITRKKNLIADAARYDNLCILHDRFVFPPEFFKAMERYGDLFSILTFPQVYFADVSRSCVQRYPDYQVLRMGEGVRDTFRTKRYDGNSIFHPRYDDFAETAFCCGGVYVVKKPVWNLIRQDESLYHCEWEDVLFGLEAQRKGIPHRVNPYVCFESVISHPLLMTRINLLDPSGSTERSVLHISDHHRRKVSEGNLGFLPVVKTTRAAYCERVAKRFNALPMVDEATRLFPSDFSGTMTLSEIWEAVCRQMQRLTLTHRDEVFSLFTLYSDLVYNHPACILQSWTWEAERRLCGDNKVTTDVGASLRRAFDEGGVRQIFVRTIEYFRRHRLWLREEDRASSPALFPFRDLVSYFREVELYYPRIFSDDFAGNCNRHGSSGSFPLMEDKSYWRVIFVRHGDEVLPPLSHEHGSQS